MNTSTVETLFSSEPDFYYREKKAKKTTWISDIANSIQGPLLGRGKAPWAPSVADDCVDFLRMSSIRTTFIEHEIARLSSVILNRGTVNLLAISKASITFRSTESERPFISFSASDFEVEALLSARAKALGNTLFRWISGLTISTEEASKLLEHAVLDALSSLASTLRNEYDISSNIEINPVLRGRLLGGIATRLGRVDRKMGDVLAEQLIEHLEDLLDNKLLRVDGGTVYVAAGKLFLKLEKLVSVREIYENIDGKWGPASDVSL